MIVKMFVRSTSTVQIATAWKNSVRSISFRKVKHSLYNHFTAAENKPPYYHICQIGDPVLRAKSKIIEPEVIQSPLFQKLLKHMEKVMTDYKSVGLSAPQIGLPWQVFLIKVTEKDLKGEDPKVKEIYEMEPVPLKVCINPQLKVTDYTEILYSEGCASIRGYTAVVPRVRAVEITALDALGQPFTWAAKGWAARIAQHEYDHLQGILYTDKMDVSTFACACWQEVNRHSGRIEIPFFPI